VRGDGQDLQLVVDDEAVLARAQRQQEALVESTRHVVARLCAKTRMHVLQKKKKKNKSVRSKVTIFPRTWTSL
jgi:hypothetical protein